MAFVVSGGLRWPALTFDRMHPFTFDFTTCTQPTNALTNNAIAAPSNFVMSPTDSTTQQVLAMAFVAVGYTGSLPRSNASFHNRIR